jgi:hypothetical protein
MSPWTCYAVKLLALELDEVLLWLMEGDGSASREPSRDGATDHRLKSGPELLAGGCKTQCI